MSKLSRAIFVFCLFSTVAYGFDCKLFLRRIGTSATKFQDFRRSPNGRLSSLIALTSIVVGTQFLNSRPIEEDSLFFSQNFFRPQSSVYFRFSTDPTDGGRTIEFLRQDGSIYKLDIETSLPEAQSLDPYYKIAPRIASREFSQSSSVAPVPQ